MVFYFIAFLIGFFVIVVLGILFWILEDAYNSSFLNVILISIVLGLMTGILAGFIIPPLIIASDYCPQHPEDTKCILISESCPEGTIPSIFKNVSGCYYANMNGNFVSKETTKNYRFKTDCELNPRYNESCWGAQYFNETFKEEIKCIKWNGTTEFIVFNITDFSNLSSFIEVFNMSYPGEYDENTVKFLSVYYSSLEDSMENETFIVRHSIKEQEETEYALAQFYPGTILAEPNKNLDYTWMHSSISYEDKLTREGARVEMNFEANKCIEAERIWVRR